MGLVQTGWQKALWPPRRGSAQSPQSDQQGAVLGQYSILRLEVTRSQGPPPGELTYSASALSVPGAAQNSTNVRSFNPQIDFTGREIESKIVQSHTQGHTAGKWQS